MGGNNVITGAIDTGASIVVSVTSGMLNLDGAVSTMAFNFVKTGCGTLELGGSQDNVILGGMYVLDGTLLLNKQNAAEVAGSVEPFHAALLVGDDLQGANAAVVKLLQPNQIPYLDYWGDTLQADTIYSSGQLNLNGQSETLGTLTMNQGPTYSANIQMGGGTLTMAGDWTVSAACAAGPQSPPVVVGGASPGTLNLGTFFTGSGCVTRNITVNSTTIANIAPNLEINAAITGAVNISLTKAGAGTLELAGTNTYSGGTLINAGTVDVTNNSPFGSGPLETTAMGLMACLPSNATSVLPGPANVTISNTFYDDGNIYVWGLGNITFSGVTYLSSSRPWLVEEPTTTLTFSGCITQDLSGATANMGGNGVPASGIAKYGLGTLVLSNYDDFGGNIAYNTDAGTILLTGNGALPNVNGINAISEGDAFIIDDTANTTVAPPTRLNPFGYEVDNGGDFLYYGNGSSTLRIGMFYVGAGDAERLGVSNGCIVATGLAYNAQTAVTFEALGCGSSTQNLGSSGADQISFVNPPTAMTNGIIPYAEVVGNNAGVATNDLATLVQTAAGVNVVAFTNYVTNLNTALPTDNVRLYASAAPTVSLTSSRAVNALIIDPGVTLTTSNDSELSVGGVSPAGVAGGGGNGTVIFAGNNTAAVSTISVDALNLGAVSVIMTGNGVQAAINCPIEGGATDITKAGLGNLVLSGCNTFTGSFNVAQGLVTATNSYAFGTVTGQTYVKGGAQLQLAGNINVLQEPLTIDSYGNLGSVIGQSSVAVLQGGLVSLSGNNTWAGTVTLNGGQIAEMDWSGYYTGGTSTDSVTPIGVEGSSSLNLSGVVSGGEVLMKLGTGTLILSGDLPNTFSTAPARGAGHGDAQQGPRHPGRIRPDQRRLRRHLGPRPANPEHQRLRSVPEQPERDAQQHRRAERQRQRVVQRQPGDGAGQRQLRPGEHQRRPDADDDQQHHRRGAVRQQRLHQQHQSAGRGGQHQRSRRLALNYPAQAAVNRNWTINDSANVISDLVISAPITEGNSAGVFTGIAKYGCGALQLSGSTSNTFRGTFTVYQGQVFLNKSGGALAMSGPLTIGSNNLYAGGTGAQDVEIWQSNQLPAYDAAVTVNETGLLQLGNASTLIPNGPLTGISEVIGNVDGSTALTVTCGIISNAVYANGVVVPEGNLTINGDIVTADTVTLTAGPASPATFRP